MKRSGVINGPLAGAIAGLRHTDLFVVCDSGLSAPPGAAVFDLAIEYGSPIVTPVLRALLDDVVVEAAWVASEMADRNPVRRQEVTALLAKTPVTAVPHQELRALLPEARFFVRTGDDKPYSNVVLRAGVAFDV
jgi:D-ribose pyranase